MTKKARAIFLTLLIALLFFSTPTRAASFTSVNDSLPELVSDTPVIESTFYPYTKELNIGFAMESNQLNPYGIDVSTLYDSICLVLTDTLHCAFSIPNSGRVNSTFGWRGRRIHSGIDLQLHWGDTVNAAFNGVVRVSKYGRGYGHYIIVRHQNGLETLYAHLQKRFARKGDTVYAGEVIGLGGSTGRSTGAHLHFETRFLGRPIDPETFIDFQNNRLKTQALSIHSRTFDVPRTKRSKRMF